MRSRREISRRYWYKKSYGITIAEYTERLNAQDYKCAICGRRDDELKEHLSIDHDHKTGKIRGLLCRKCNAGLGMLEGHLGEAILYLTMAR